MATEGQIILRRSDGQWVALHTGPLGDRVRELFGSRVIPTAYTAGAKATDVVNAIRALNPDTSVILG